MTPDNPLVTLGYRLCDTCHTETHPDDLASPHECKRCAPKDFPLSPKRPRSKDL